MAEAETAPSKAEGHAEDGGGHDDPLHHIQDYTVATIPVGSYRLEVTRSMQDVTVVALLIGVVVIAVARRVIRNVHADQAPRGALANAVEAALVFLRDEVVVPVGGHHMAHYTPLFLTYFLFILIGNLAGMIPVLFKGPTANIGVTAALGGSVFVILTLLGIWKQGPVAYLIHMVPPGTPWWLWPLMFVLEFMGPVIKCFVLCIRLFANMIAGHLVLSNILGLGVFKTGAVGMAVMGLAIGLPLAIGVSFLELLVCAIQAYVFTMLSVIFVGAAVHPSH
jgi:F-type H+-transporting ATPase subunit a